MNVDLLRWPGLSLALVWLGIPGIPVTADQPQSTVEGTVFLEGQAPVPKQWPHDSIMQRHTGKKFYIDETWLVGKNNGLANCVVTLHALSDANRSKPEPGRQVVIDKVDVRYVPRVLVVTPGTHVLLRNQDSPCRGFHISSKSPVTGNAANYFIKEGTQRQVKFQGPDHCSLSCPQRPCTQGYVHVVATPYFAVSDAHGRFLIDHVPPGKYQFKVWHEAVGDVAGATDSATLQVEKNRQHQVTFKIKGPLGQ